MPLAFVTLPSWSEIFEILKSGTTHPVVMESAIDFGVFLLAVWAVRWGLRRFSVRALSATDVLSLVERAGHLQFAVDAHDRLLFCTQGLRAQLKPGETPQHWFAEWLSLCEPALDYNQAKASLLATGSFWAEATDAAGQRRIISGHCARGRSIFYQGASKKKRISVWSLGTSDLESSSSHRQALKHGHLSRIIDQSPIGILTIDTDGRIQDYNQTFQILAESSLGHELKPGELRNFSLIQLFDAVEGQESIQTLLAFLRGETVKSPAEMTLVGKSQMVVQLYLNRSQHLEDSLHTLYFVNITEQKRMSQQFAHAQKMHAIGQLAGGIAHDFNNLLTAMIGFCDLLLLRHSPSDLSFNDIMQIKQNANRAANLVRQLLAFSRQQTLDPKVLDVTDILVDLASLLRRLIGPSIDLRMKHEQNLGLIKADKGQIEQLITNLVVNARDAMPEGGQLVITTQNSHAEAPQTIGAEIIPPGDYVIIQVEDTGVGIAREHLPHIFEPFFSTKAVGAGTGLGLSMVYGIVKQSGGFIAVESQERSGATFQVYLPQQFETAQDALPSLEKAPVVRVDLTGTSNVMLVEDEDAVRMYAARALRDKGYKVVEASNGEEALFLLTHETDVKIDILVTDVIMAPVDGTTLALKAREIFPHLEILFVSGYAEDSLRQKLSQIPRVRFLPKPFELKELAEKVKEVEEALRASSPSAMAS